MSNDIAQSETKRWVSVAPKSSEECCLLLFKGVDEEQRSRISNQTGGRVFLFLKTDDCWGDYESMKQKDITFMREPKTEDYEIITVF